MANDIVYVNCSAATTTAPAPANAAPSITFAAVSGAVAGTAFTLSGTASDSDGTISKVEVFRAGVSLGLATISSGNWSKSVTESAAATVSYSATATDNGGAKASASRSVVVGTASSGTALDAGSIAAGTVTDTSIQVLNSASASGGSGTITYQHHRSTSPISSPPSSATAISGATTAAYTHTGLAASTAYYFKRVSTDGAGTVVTTSGFTATTSAAGTTEPAKAGPVDTFTGTTLDTTKWLKSFVAATFTQTADRVEAVPSADNANTYTFLTTAVSFDATGKTTHVEVVQVLPQVLDTYRSYTVYIWEQSAGNNVKINVDGGYIIWNKTVANTSTRVGAILYNATNHRWWRFREASGTIYYEASPTGAAGSWTVLGSTPNPWAVTNLVSIFGAGYFVATATPGKAIFDNFNA